jgi:AcrR family transcriptional regulator
LASRTQGVKAGLTRGQILDAALRVVDADGLESLSMRRLAAELGVEAMTLYHYIPSKRALLSGVVELVFSDATKHLDGARGWHVALNGYAHGLRATMLRHPRVLPIALGHPVSTAKSLHLAEESIALLTGAGFSLGRSVDILNAVSIFVVGHAVAEVATGPINAASEAGSTADLATLDPEQFPLISEAARTGVGTDDDERFAFAVRSMLAGFALELELRPTRNSQLRPRQAPPAIP